MVISVHLILHSMLSILAGTLTDGTIINLEEFEGRSVSFQCSHRLAGSNNKYFCKDPSESGRIALMDSGDGSFTVTFSNLQLSDSQKYWCAVERTGFDTYVEVQLTVKKGIYGCGYEPSYAMSCFFDI
uniref:Immunoglobulin domain-containing protein n=1 Tax=Haplochromis burtoni TaxID=8153 RepID=A0A3Q3C4G0_HAPBU